MDASRFGKIAFEAAGRDTIRARRHADRLQEAVAKALHPTVVRAFREVVRELNQEGHRLTLCCSRTGEMTFSERRRGDVVGLRLSCDVTISAGYSHVVSKEKAWSMSEKEWDALSGTRRAGEGGRRRTRR